MLNIIDEQKMMFWDDRYSHNYVFRFPETTLSFDNEQLHSEEMTLQESICDEEDLKLGGCVASHIEFVVSEIMAEEIAGLSFTAEIEVKDEDGLVVQVVPMGSYIVDAAEQMNDNDYKKVIAYDYIYEMSVDVSEWYNSFFADGATHTVKETREALLEYLGASYIVQTLPNDDVLLEKTVEPNGNLTGTELLRSICEINGAFGRMNRKGFFEEIFLGGFGIFPEDNMGETGNTYPKETLYPEEAFEYLGQSDGSNICPQWRSTKYEEYMTLPITCLNIQSTAEDVGVTIGDDLSNPYVITANILLYGKTVDELQNIGSSILSQIKGLTYRPNITELDGLPYLECGDSFCLTKKNDTVESHIFSRTLKGIQALIDTFESKGNKVRANEVTANEEIQQLKGKTLVIKKDIEGIRTEVSNLEKSTSSRFEQTANAIEMEVKRASGEEEKLSSSIKANADNIALEVQRATKAEDVLSASINLNAGQIVLKVDSDGNIVEVALGTDTNDESKTIFQVGADNISLTADEVIELLTNGNINLSGKNITITADNYKLDSQGNCSTKSIDMNGGSINIETGLNGDNVVRIRYVKWEGNTGIKYYGYGEPHEKYDSPTKGDTYLDLDTGKAYISKMSGSWSWLANYEKDNFTFIDTYMDAEGCHADSYSKKTFELDDGGEQEFSAESKSLLKADGLHFENTDYNTSGGVPKQTYSECNINAGVIGSDDANNPISGFMSDSPFYIPNIKSGVESMTFNGTSVSKTVTFDNPFPCANPVVICTPVHLYSWTARCFVSNITQESFNLTVYRDSIETEDPEGNNPYISVNWIAIYNEEGE